HSRYAEPDWHADGDLWPVVVGGRAGGWCWRSRVVAVRNGPAARSAAGEAVAAAASGDDRAARRLVPDRRDGRRRGGAGRAGIVAGGVAAHRPERLSRVRGPDARAARPRLGPDAG